MSDPRLLPPQDQLRARGQAAGDRGLHRGYMTDRYAMKEHRRLFAVGEIH